MTYEIEVLDHRKATDPGFAATTVDLTDVGKVFGRAHRFIIDYCHSSLDDCCLPYSLWRDTISASTEYGTAGQGPATTTSQTARTHAFRQVRSCSRDESG